MKRLKKRANIVVAQLLWNYSQAVTAGPSPIVVILDSLVSQLRTGFKKLFEVLTPVGAGVTLIIFLSYFIGRANDLAVVESFLFPIGFILVIVISRFFAGMLMTIEENRRHILFFKKELDVLQKNN